ncbi:reverse transcriptase domain-containing protein [Tanacetum coccineum]
MDDMVIKRKSEGSLIEDIKETFNTLRHINMKLNPKKCVLGIETDQFLGHMITKQGIKANPEKVKAVIDMISPRTIREVQSLNGKLAALDRFLAKSVEKALPFFKTLKGFIYRKDFQWNQEAKSAFQELKLNLQSLPALVVPTLGETLMLYLAVSHETISSVLMAERKNVQRPSYFVSKALQGPDVNYPLLKKLALSLVHTARRLRRYFQAHTICVLTDQPIRQILLKPENSGRLAKWDIKLGKHDIIYKPRSAVKGQVIADFIAECPNNTSPLQIKETSETFSESQDKMPVWTLYTDGASGSDGSGAGLILTDLVGKEITYALRFDFPTSNNKGEYEALIAGLELALRVEVRHLQVFTDSLLVTNHVKGAYKAREESMKRKLASSSFTHLTKNVLVEVIPYKSIEVHATDTVEDVGETWMTLIIKYLQDGRLPEDPNLARKIRIKAPQYSMKQGVLYRIRFRIPGVIISDNEKQFAENLFHDWCNELKIKQKFTSIAHPQANGQKEVTNRTLLQGLKTRLGKAKGQWVEELPNVLWAHRKTAKTRNHCTPFSLVYGSEAVLPPKIKVPTYRIQSYEENKNNADLRLNLELLEERRELASLCEAKYKRQTERYYNSKVRHAKLKVDDFVLRKNEVSRQEGHKKLDPNWEGPYQIIKSKRPETYVLKDLHGKLIPRTWHISNLRIFNF